MDPKRRRAFPLVPLVPLVPWVLGAPAESAAAVPERAALEARVAAVRSALAAHPGTAPVWIVQASPWNNWPKWSKWSNWANQ